MNRTIEPFEFYYAAHVIVADALAFYDKNGPKWKGKGYPGEYYRLVKIGSHRQVGHTMAATKLCETFAPAVLVTNFMKERDRIVRELQMLPQPRAGKNQLGCIDEKDIFTAEQVFHGRALHGRQYDIAVLDYITYSSEQFRDVIFTHLLHNCKLIVEIG